MTAQPDTVQRTREEKFRWDEENRLTALSQNGYVSHYYGARYMNPRLSVWYGCDPMQEKYPEHTSYEYTLSNPVNRKDPDGLLSI